MCYNTSYSAKKETLFLREKIKTRGNFPSTLDSPTSTAGANMELGLGKGTLLSEEFMEIATDAIKCGYNCL